MSIVLHGIAVGGGIAIGRALLLQQGLDNIPHYAIEAHEVKDECLRFQAAVKLTRRQLEQLRNNIPENAPTELGAFISLHLMLLILAPEIKSNPPQSPFPKGGSA